MKEKIKLFLLYVISICYILYSLFIVEDFHWIRFTLSLIVSLAIFPYFFNKIPEFKNKTIISIIGSLILLIFIRKFTVTESERKAIIEKQRIDDSVYIAQQPFRDSVKKEEEKQKLKEDLEYNLKYKVIQAIKNSCKDPQSFEEESSSVTQLKNGNYEVYVRFRATNSFGGIIESSKTFLFTNSGEFIREK